MIMKITDNRKGRPACGFTMLEMMIIVVIIGIVAALAAPSFLASGPRIKARTEARNVLNFIRLARSNAISNGSQYGVYVDTANKKYLLFKDTYNPSGMSYDMADSTISGPVPLPNDVTFNSTFTGNTVIFLSTGRASESGDFNFGIQGGGTLYSVSVLASTGRSKLQ